MLEAMLLFFVTSFSILLILSLDWVFASVFSCFMPSWRTRRTRDLLCSATWLAILAILSLESFVGLDKHWQISDSLSFFSTTLLRNRNTDKFTIEYRIQIQPSFTDAFVYNGLILLTLSKMGKTGHIRFYCLPLRRELLPTVSGDREW